MAQQGTTTVQLTEGHVVRITRNPGALMNEYGPPGAPFHDMKELYACSCGVTTDQQIVIRHHANDVAPGGPA